MLTVIESPESVVQLIMTIGCTLMGVSHIVQPQLWMEFFADLHARGRAGLVAKIMMVELWPALAIVALHQVWHGPGMVLTIFGWLLLAKVAVGLIVPLLALRSMAIPQRAPRSFVPAGVVLLAIGAAAGAALLWP